MTALLNERNERVMDLADMIVDCFAPDMINGIKKEMRWLYKEDIEGAEKRKSETIDTLKEMFRAALCH